MNKTPMEKIAFTPQEERALRRSGDLALAGRMKQSAIAVSVLFLVLFVLAAFIVRNNFVTMAVGVVYIVLTLAEKLAFIRIIAVYRGLAVKLGKALNGENP